MSCTNEERQEFRTNSGIPVNESYGPQDIAQLDYDRDIGLPGQPPYTRGIYATMYRGRLWSIRQFSGHSTPEETNQWFHREYEMGQTGFSVAFDVPTESGIDSDDPRAEADVGVGGVAADTIQDFETVFDGLPIDQVGTSIVAGCPATCQATAMYFAMAEKRGFDLKRLPGTGGTDLVTGMCAEPLMDLIPPRHMLRICMDLIEWSCKVAPRWHPVNIDMYNIRESGVTAPQELAYMFAEVAGYIDEELRRNRLSIDEFAPNFAYNMSMDTDFFEEIAKLRAARRMLHKLMTQRYGAKNPRSYQFRVHVQTGGSTHTRQQPLNNVVRIAYEVLAAALGGTQSLHANAYDEAICLPTEESLKLALRTQQIAQLETKITNVVDPLAGSYYVESLTDTLEKEAWDYVAKIEQAGGLVGALESGWMHREFIKAMVERQKEIEHGKRKVVGVNCFVEPDEPYPGRVFRANPETINIQRAKLKKIRAVRDNGRVQKALDQLRRDLESGANVMPSVMEAVKAYASMGEISKVWCDIFGIWVPPIH